MLLRYAPQSQWRDRAGFSPASLLASVKEEHKTHIQLHLNCNTHENARQEQKERLSKVNWGLAKIDISQ